MDLIIKGAIAGLTLSFLIGPVFFAIVQTGVEKGFRAGLALCSGIWMSDLVIILLSFWSLSYIVRLVQWEGFSTWVGTIGGLILITFGLAAILNRAEVKTEEDKLSIKKLQVAGLWLKGFLVNTFNPFTIVFWLGLMSTIVAQSAQTGREASRFFLSLLSVMIFFDLLKVLLSRQIRKWVNVSKIHMIRKGTGVLLLIFGIVLFVRVWMLQA